jgi:hypothetical protein
VSKTARARVCGERSGGSAGVVGVVVCGEDVEVGGRDAAARGKALLGGGSAPWGASLSRGGSLLEGRKGHGMLLLDLDGGSRSDRARLCLFRDQRRPVCFFDAGLVMALRSRPCG